MSWSHSINKPAYSRFIASVDSANIPNGASIFALCNEIRHMFGQYFHDIHESQSATAYIAPVESISENTLSIYISKKITAHEVAFVLHNVEEVFDIREDKEDFSSEHVTS